MPTRNDDPPREDYWDATYCAYPGCQNVLKETETKHHPYCGIECETQAIMDMQEEADAYADSLQDDDLNADVSEWLNRTGRATQFTGNRGIE